MKYCIRQKTQKRVNPKIPVSRKQTIKPEPEATVRVRGRRYGDSMKIDLTCHTPFGAMCKQFCHAVSGGLTVKMSSYLTCC